MFMASMPVSRTDMLSGRSFWTLALTPWKSTPIMLERPRPIWIMG